ncbi:hypothetical protein K435DRAFT_890661 [Dendrothele bispora CBS 962.96]|uniref:Uncharacterized protein n=1 Tax=Dendrothele bispora (strain CBS 962.96) TaxID=1314807 RepID=A0A4S8KQ54_DENBC|nr:hypothetical protein K435DRAFT_890661 [Dendrothele bispora CBS 962.96]
MIDVSQDRLRALEKVQLGFIRRLLCLSSHSIKAVLYTETGLLSIRFRRLVLCLRLLAYMVSLPSHKYVHLALKANISLVQEGKPCWLQDLRIALARLPEPLHLPLNLIAASNDDIMAIAKKVSQVADRELQADIQNNIRVYLLHNRLEPREEGPPKRFTCTLRHYLYLIPNPKYRNALTWLRCGQHDYALESLR